MRGAGDLFAVDGDLVTAERVVEGDVMEDRGLVVSVPGIRAHVEHAVLHGSRGGVRRKAGLRFGLGIQRRRDKGVHVHVEPGGRCQIVDHNVRRRLAVGVQPLFGICRKRQMERYALAGQNRADERVAKRREDIPFLQGVVAVVFNQPVDAVRLHPKLGGNLAVVHLGQIRAQHMQAPGSVLRISDGRPVSLDIALDQGQGAVNGRASVVIIIVIVFAVALVRRD